MSVKGEELIMDREKLGELYDKYIKGLVYFINGYVHDIAASEDLAEDVFVEILLKPDRFRKASSEKTFLYAIGKNKAIDYIRHESRVVNFFDGESDDEPDESVGIETGPGIWEAETSNDIVCELIEKERNEQLRIALSKLKENYRMAIYLSFFEDLSNEEIAQVMKCSKKQVENYLYRGKNELKGFEI